MFCRPAPTPSLNGPLSPTTAPGPGPAPSSSSQPTGFPPSLREILEAFSKDGGGDRDLLLAILGAKRAEEEVSRLPISSLPVSISSPRGCGANFSPSFLLPIDQTDQTFLCLIRSVKRLASQLAYQAQLCQLQQQYNLALQSTSRLNPSFSPCAVPLPQPQPHPHQQQQQPPSPVPTSPSSKSSSSDHVISSSSSDPKTRRSPSVASSSSSSSSRYHPYSPPSASSAPLPSASSQKFRSPAMAQVNAKLLAKRAFASPPKSHPSPPLPAALTAPGSASSGSRKMAVSDLLSSTAISGRIEPVRRDRESNLRTGSSEEDEGEEEL
jgi:hypothetical protein